MPEDYIDQVGLAGDARFAEFRAWYSGMRRYLATVEYLRGMPLAVSPPGYLQKLAGALLQVVDLTTFPSEDITDTLDTALGRAHFVATPIEEHQWFLLRKCTVTPLSVTSGAWLANIWLGQQPRFSWNATVGENECMNWVRVAIKSPLKEKRLPEITMWALREHYRADYEYLVALAAHAG